MGKKKAKGVLKCTAVNGLEKGQTLVIRLSGRKLKMYRVSKIRPPP